MKLYGKLVKNTKIIREIFVENNDDSVSFADKLEGCLLGLCKELDISAPLWLKKNTKELGAFRKTSFTQEHFVEKIRFDSFEIRLA